MSTDRVRFDRIKPGDNLVVIHKERGTHTRIEGTAFKCIAGLLWVTKEQGQLAHRNWLGLEIYKRSE